MATQLNSHIPDVAAPAQAWASRFAVGTDAPAVAIAVTRRDGTCWTFASGEADVELGVAATPRHLFRIGSVSKAITATLAARLVTRGIVELDTPIAYWLPDLPPHHRATTLRQLLTHRGGLRHYLHKDAEALQPGGAIFARPSWTREQVMAAFIDDPLVCPPGTMVSYSSWSYTLAAMVLEAAACVPFLDLVAQEVALPFGLPSLAADEPARVIPQRARGYAGRQERERLRAAFPHASWPEVDGAWANAAPINPAYCWAGAGFLMDAGDMARFGAAHLPGAGGPVGDAERALLFTPLTEASDTSPPLGLGWRVDRDAQGRLRWHHAGATPGGRASLVVYPDQDLSIAILANTMIAPGDVLGPSAELASLFAGQLT